MLHNLYADLCGNTELICVWEGDTDGTIIWTLIVEDPLSGEPCVVSHQCTSGLLSALREAWDFIALSGALRVLSHASDADSVASIWARDFGPYFSRLADIAGPKAIKISGVAYTVWQARGLERG